jgi:hypothetical protein
VSALAGALFKKPAKPDDAYDDVDRGRCFISYLLFHSNLIILLLT